MKRSTIAAWGLLVAAWTAATFTNGYALGARHERAEKRLALERYRESFDKLNTAFREESKNVDSLADSFHEAVAANAGNEKSLRNCIAGWGRTIADLNGSAAAMRKATAALREDPK